MRPIRQTLFCQPPEVTLVNLVAHEVVVTHSLDIILTPVPTRCPVTLGEVRNTEIKLLCKALEILEILESSLWRYIPILVTCQDSLYSW